MLPALVQMPGRLLWSLPDLALPGRRSLVGEVTGSSKSFLGHQASSGCPFPSLPAQWCPLSAGSL